MPPPAFVPRSSSATRSSTSPPPTRALAHRWPSCSSAARTASSAIREIADSGAHRLPLAGVRLAPPVQPRKFFAIGLNYADHVAESGQPTPEHLTVFIKASSCVTGPYDPVQRPAVSDFLDYEGELGVRHRPPLPPRPRARTPPT